MLSFSLIGHFYNYIGPNFLFRKGGARPFSSINRLMTSHVWWQNYASYVHANFSHFYLGIFCLRISCLFQVSIETLKKCLLMFGNNCERMNNVWYEL